MKAPSASRKVLVLLAGIVWSAVGLALIALATGWLISSHRAVTVSLAIGTAVGLAVYRYGFSKLVDVNLVRIYEQAPGKDRICVFAFQNTRSYLIIATMMLTGYALRHLPIAKFYLVPVYLSIGLSLLLSSMHYYVRLK